MDINALREFTVLAQSETFLKAADLLFISQPTLSRHIKNLEAELGVSLFERTTRSSKLTKQGHMLLPYAQQIVELYQQFSNDLIEEKKEQHSILRLCSIAAMDTYGITTMITRFKELYPQAKTSIVPRHNISVLDMLHNRSCDLVFARERMDEEDNTVERLTMATDQLVAVVSTADPLAQKSVIDIVELKGKDIISLPEGTSICQIFWEACEKAGFAPELVMTHHNTEHIFNCAKLGMGVAVLPDRLLEAEWATGGQVTVVAIEPPVRTSINLCWAKNLHLPESAQDFIEMFREEFQMRDEM